MLTIEGKPMPEFFGLDMLHMNTRGYALWEKLVKKHLIKKESIRITYKEVMF